jgi:DNA-binding transcriptional MerR regulator
MDELVERVRLALAAEYAGAPNGRVRDLPDRRAIRWYTTTGLVDRPLGMRGRTALYGQRHLLQLVALKRRQAEGRTLAEIQAELAGAPDEALTAVARVPKELLIPDGPQPDQSDTPARTRFWAADAWRPDVWTADPTSAEASDSLPDRAKKPKRTTKTADPRSTSRSGFGTAPPEPNRKHPVPASPPPAPAIPIGGVALRGGAILVLPQTPTPDDRAAIAAAAEPLLTLLEARGLLEPSRTPETSDQPEDPQLAR